MDALYESLGDGLYRPSDLTRGPWDPGAQHGGAPAALLAGLLERADPGADMRMARITYELLRPVPLADLRAEARVVRPGRRVQLVRAQLSADDQVVVSALALRLRRGQGPSAGGERGAPPGPEKARAERFPHEDQTQRSFAGVANDIRFVEGHYSEPGPALAWLSLRTPVVAGEPVSGVQRAAAAADFGNGVSAALDWNTYAFINPDLTLYLERDPEGEWIALDAVTRLASDGTGTAESVMSDRAGRIGRAVQGLLVQPR
jgi:Thioesterase-like superfamily